MRDTQEYSVDTATPSWLQSEIADRQGPGAHKIVWQLHEIVSLLIDHGFPGGQGIEWNIFDKLEIDRLG